MRALDLAAVRQEAIAFWRSLGVAPVPLVPRGKRPLKERWQEDRADAWDDVPLDANLGVLTGPPSEDLVVLDFDDVELCRVILGMTPRALAVHTIVVETSRGVHVYARHEGVQTCVPREGYSVLGMGSLAVAPPSIHASGKQYRFMAEPRRLAPLTDFSDPSDLVKPHEPPTPSHGTRSNTTDSNMPGARGYGGRRPGRRGALGAPLERPACWPRVEAWMAQQSPKLRASWNILKGEAPEPVGWDRSRADFAVCVSLAEAGVDLEDAVGVLLALPRSKAQERNELYARRTARRAFEAAGVLAP